METLSEWLWQVFRNVATAILLVVRVEATSTSKFNNLKNTFVWLTE
jgi:hypothetical protein